MDPGCPCMILLDMARVQGPDHSTHFSESYLKQATLSEVKSPVQVKSRLAFPTYKNSEFLKFSVLL